MVKLGRIQTLPDILRGLNNANFLSSPQSSQMYSLLKTKIKIFFYFKIA